jgi:hypothetical protein
MDDCIYATLGTCHSVWMTGMQSTIQRDKNQVISPDDGYIVDRNMYRKEITNTKKNCAPSWIYLQE